MYVIYSVNVETLDIVLHASVNSLFEAQTKLQDSAREFIRLEQGEKFAKDPYYDSHNPPRPGYYLVHSESPKQIFVYFNELIVDTGLIWNSSKSSNKKVFIYSYCEAPFEKSETTKLCSKSPELLPTEILNVKALMLDELKNVFLKKKLD